MVQQPIEAQGQPTDYVNFSSGKKERTSSRFRGELCSSRRVPRSLLAFVTEIIATDQQLPKFLTLRQRSDTLAESSSLQMGIKRNPHYEF